MRVSVIWSVEYDGQVRRWRVLRYERRRQEEEGKRTRTPSSALHYLFLPNGNDLKAACVRRVCSVQGQLVTDGDLLCECASGSVKLLMNATKEYE